MSRLRFKKKSNRGIFLKLALLLMAISVVVFIYFSPIFEKIPPKIIAPEKIYANEKTVIKFTLTDNKSIQNCKVILSANGKELPIYSQNFLLKDKKKDIEIKIPQEIIKSNIIKWDIEIVANDNSLWNFTLGNKARYKSKLIIDKTPPVIKPIAYSKNVLKGGSGVVIFKAIDDSLKNLFIYAGNGVKFKPIKYKKDGIYATLIVWPFNHDNFNPVIVAIDSAGNIAKYALYINKLYKKYRVSKIKATNRFINGKILDLASIDPDYSKITNKLEKFRAINELMRKKNENYIHSLTKKITPFENSWTIKPFKPLHGSKKISGFGTKRFYYYGSADNIISTSYHVGYDFANIKHDNLYASNEGRVVSIKNNGIYGNMPLIDHGFGLYSLYGHCSSILVEKGQKLQGDEVIAKTGTSGLALGDHVHFGILIQGVETYPLEWMRKKWIDEHIINIFKKADKIIGLTK